MKLLVFLSVITLTKVSLCLAATNDAGSGNGNITPCIVNLEPATLSLNEGSNRTVCVQTDDCFVEMLNEVIRQVQLNIREPDPGVLCS